MAVMCRIIFALFCELSVERRSRTHSNDQRYKSIIHEEGAMAAAGNESRGGQSRNWNRKMSVLRIDTTATTRIWHKWDYTTARAVPILAF